MSHKTSVISFLFFYFTLQLKYIFFNLHKLSCQNDKITAIKHQICCSESLTGVNLGQADFVTFWVETHLIGPWGPAEVVISQDASVGWSHHRSAADSPPDGPDVTYSLHWIHSAPCSWSCLGFKILTMLDHAGPGQAWPGSAAGGIPSSHESFSPLIFANRCTPKKHKPPPLLLLSSPFFDQWSFNKSSWLDANVPLCMWKAEATEGLVLIRPKLINGRLKLPPEVWKL